MEWINHPAWSFVGVAAGIVGIAFAILFYRRSLRRKAISYDVRHFNLISPDVASLDGVELTYKGRSIRTLTASKFLIWNSGNEIINAQDIADGDRLRIDIGTAEFLDARVTHQTHETNRCLATIDPQNPGMLRLTFDYLAAGQGMTLAVLTSGGLHVSSVVGGTVKGFGSPILQREKGSRLSVVGFIIGLVLGVTPGLILVLTHELIYFAVSSLVVLLFFILGLRTILLKRLVFRSLVRAITTRPACDRAICERFDTDFSSDDFDTRQIQRTR